MEFSRRHFFRLIGAGILPHFRLARAQQQPGTETEPIREFSIRSKVALIRGEDRRKMARKKYVIIKPNSVSTVNPLATATPTPCGASWISSPHASRSRW